MKNKLIFVLVSIFIYQITLAHVRILYPVGGETFNAGESIDIEWDPYVDHGSATFTIEYSIDGGNTWSIIQTEIAKNIRSYSWTIPNIQTEMARIKIIQVNSEYEDFEDFSGDVIITSVTSIDDGSFSAQSFELNNTYPNPFNSSTFISFQLQERRFTQLIVYDIQGHEIKKIVNQIKSAGKHETSWSAAGLPSGTYILVLRSDNYIASKKLILLK